VTPFTIPDDSGIPSTVDALQSVLVSASCNSILWQIRQFRDNMQRLAILSALAIASMGWLMLQQRPLVAFQAEPEADQQVPASNAAEPAAPGEEPVAEPPSPSGTTPPPAAPPKPPADPAIVAAAEQLLRDARDRLYAYPAVRAKFIERATIGNRRFSASGSYLSGKYPSLKLEYRVQIGGSEGVLKEVCDGNVLRTSKEIHAVGSGSDEPSVSQWTRKDINEILRVTKTEGTPDAAMLQAELSLGGIPSLLTSFERTMLFESLKHQTWQGRPVIVIEGGWRLETIQRIAQQMGPQLQTIANLIPDRVRVYFDEQTLFPTRVLYRKQLATDPPSFVPMLSIEFTDVEFPAEVDPEEFRYVPPKGVDEVDETQVYVQMIEQMRAAAQAAAAGLPVDATQPGSAGQSSPPATQAPAAATPATDAPPSTPIQ
jgi:hypothetical protein